MMTDTLDTSSVPFQDAEGAEIHVGVSFAGIAIYKEQIRTNKFSWYDLFLIIIAIP